MGYGTKIKGILKDKKMTIKELSERTGISLNTLYSITKRDSVNVDFKILMSIAKCLNVDLSELLDEETARLPTVEEIIRIREFNRHENKTSFFINWARVMGITIHRIYLDDKDIHGYTIEKSSDRPFFVDEDMFDKILALNADNFISLVKSLGTDVGWGSKHDL